MRERIEMVVICKDESLVKVIYGNVHSSETWERAKKVKRELEKEAPGEYTIEIAEAP